MSGRGIKGAANPERDAEMCARFKSGETLQQIGSSYGMTRERVRQLIKRSGGIVGKHGGQAVVSARNKIIRDANRDARYIKNHGCTCAQYKFLRLHGVPRRFKEQRNNALTRGVEWRFSNIWEWWLVWDQSGKWAQRGIGQGKYCMARKGDAGAYETSNVFICLATENCSNRPQKKSGLPTGVHKIVKKSYVAFTAHKMVGGKSYHIGSFKTPEAASNAYQSFSA